MVWCIVWCSILQMKEVTEASVGIKRESADRGETWHVVKGVCNCSLEKVR